MATIEDRIARSGVVAVLVIDNAAHAGALARALWEGGIRAMELTLRTPDALEALRRVRAEVPEMLAGVGTVLTPQVGEVQVAGAEFAVAPGCNPRVVRAAQEAGLFFAPGVATPSDIEQALELNCRLMKFFPAEPLGGLGLAQVAPWLRSPLVAAIGGSWIASRETIAACNWAKITQRAREAAKAVNDARDGGR